MKYYFFSYRLHENDDDEVGSKQKTVYCHDTPAVTDQAVTDFMSEDLQDTFPDKKIASLWLDKVTEK